jgi:hypothetical protein
LRTQLRLSPMGVRGRLLTIALVFVGLVLPISTASSASSVNPNVAGTYDFVCAQLPILGPTSNMTFFSFAAEGTHLSGFMIDSNVGPRRRLHLTGTLNGTRIRLDPQNGYGLFDGTLAKGRLMVESPTPGSPLQFECSPMTLQRWNAVTTRDLAAERSTHGAASLLSEAAAPLGGLGQPQPAPVGRFIPSLSGDTALIPRGLDLTFTVEPTRQSHEISVSENEAGTVIVMANRASDGSCWYYVADTERDAWNVGLGGVPEVRFGGLFSSSAADNLTCSAAHPTSSLISYPTVTAVK